MTYYVFGGTLNPTLWDIKPYSEATLLLLLANLWFLFHCL